MTILRCFYKSLHFFFNFCWHYKINISINMGWWINFTPYQYLTFQTNKLILALYRCRQTSNRNVEDVCIYRFYFFWWIVCIYSCTYVRIHTLITIQLRMKHVCHAYVRLLHLIIPTNKIRKYSLNVLVNCNIINGPLHSNLSMSY